jgi:hypothetical protein
MRIECESRKQPVTAEISKPSFCQYLIIGFILSSAPKQPKLDINVSLHHYVTRSWQCRGKENRTRCSFLIEKSTELKGRAISRFSPLVRIIGPFLRYFSCYGRYIYSQSEAVRIDSENPNRKGVRSLIISPFSSIHCNRWQMPTQLKPQLP